MLRTLYGKLSLALFGLLLVMGGLALTWTLISTQLYLSEARQRLNRDLARHIVEEIPLLEGSRVNQRGLEEIFHMLMVVNPTIEVYLLGSGGEILAYSAPPDRVRQERVSLGPVRRFLEGGRGLPISGDDPRNPGSHKVFSAAPIEVDGRTEGYVYVVLGGEEYDSVVGVLAGSYALGLGARWIAGSLLVVGMAGLVLFALLTRRLRRLSDDVRAFREADFLEPPPEAGAPPEVESGDEIDRLRSVFSEMAGRIALQVDELRETDLRRRELVAGVSHDLRTPLAALRGYLETLQLKEDSLEAAERREYLEIAARHSERLARLVADLFELATLESREPDLNREPFAPGELVQDVLPKFRLAAERKGVDLEAELQGGLPLVPGDIRLVERVLENLLENAVRFTPRGGRVTVSVEPWNGEVALRVTDTGCGIPADELPHVFDRYYRGPNGNPEPGAGVGLGLAIARRIVELHGGRISAGSAPGRGTVITFTLPREEAVMET